MIVMRIGRLGFKRHGDMTLNQYETYKSFLGGEESRYINDGTFMYVIANSFEEALDKLHKQAADYVGNIGWLKANLDDFYFTEMHSDVGNGLFWLPNSTYCQEYRLSDGVPL